MLDARQRGTHDSIEHTDLHHVRFDVLETPERSADPQEPPLQEQHSNAIASKTGADSKRNVVEACSRSIAAWAFVSPG